MAIPCTLHSSQLFGAQPSRREGGKKAFNNSNHIINKTSFYTNLKCEWLFSQSTFYKTTQQSFSKMNFQVIKMLFYIYCNHRLKKKIKRNFHLNLQKELAVIFQETFGGWLAEFLCRSTAICTPTQNRFSKAVVPMKLKALPIADTSTSSLKSLLSETNV